MPALLSLCSPTTPDGGARAAPQYARAHARDDAAAALFVCRGEADADDNDGGDDGGGDDGGGGGERGGGERDGGAGHGRRRQRPHWRLSTVVAWGDERVELLAAMRSAPLLRRVECYGAFLALPPRRWHRLVAASRPLCSNHPTGMRLALLVLVCAFGAIDRLAFGGEARTTEVGLALMRRLGRKLLLSKQPRPFYPPQGTVM